ncbi:hypothetical protein DFH28DRAFT_1106631 [Melampsora americana]|nr:hypothetical protein DFH28DRAFT_1106631 [Melampsora americana]
MITPVICLISFIHLFTIPVLSVDFWDDLSTGVFFSDIVDVEPTFESGNPKLTSFPTQDRTIPATAGDNLDHFNQILMDSWQDSYPLQYEALEFNIKDNLLPSQPYQSQILKDATPISSNIILHNTIPREELLSIDEIGNDLESINQQEAITKLMDKRTSGIKRKSNSQTDSEYHKDFEAKDKSQENREINIKKFSSNYPKDGYYVVEKTLNSVLHWQSQLLLSKRYKIFEKIEIFFIQLKQSIISGGMINMDEFTDFHQAYSIAIDKIRTNLVFGVLGALKIIFQRHVGLELMDSLILDIWEYLQNYLNEEVLFLPQNISKSVKGKKKQNTNSIGPGKLFEHTLQLQNNSKIPSKFIHQKLQEWSTTTKYKDLLSSIPIDYWSFVEECDVYCKKKTDEQTIYCARKQNKYKAITVQDDTGSNVDNEIKENATRLSTTRFVWALISGGKQLAAREEIYKFFSQLHSDTDSIKKPEKHVEVHCIEFYQGKDTVNKDMVHKAIQTAQFELTPAFFGLLRLMHPKMKVDLTWDDIYQSGWEFLKNYFTLWIKLQSETDHPLILSPSGRISLTEEWSNLKETINYLSSSRYGHPLGQRIVWFLIESWYDEILFPKHYNKKPSDFEVLPPHRTNIAQRCQEMKRRKFV